MPARAAEKCKLIDYRMIWRWHFYAGLLCIPFIIILSITGPIYLFKPQIEAAIDSPYDQVMDKGMPQTIKAQINAAEAANPGWKFAAVEVRQDARDATRIQLMRGGDKLRVYVHPQSLLIMKQIREDERFMAIVKTIHGELVAGRTGEIIVELAASWAIVMILTGLYLWWPRGAKGLRSVFWPRLDAGSRIFWRDIHAVTGMYISALALFLLLTGLPWTYVWGNGFKMVRGMGQPPAKTQDWSHGRAEERQMARTVESATGYDDIDPLLDMVRALDLPPPVMLSPPKAGEHLWKAQSQTGNRPKAVTVKIMSGSLEILGREGFTDKKPVDKIIGIGIAAHEGQLFGWFNQVLGLVAATGLLTLCLSAVVMWWKRRPSNALGAPPQLPNEHLGAGLAMIIIGLGVFLPVFGISLIVIGVIEYLVLRRLPDVRSWLGLP